MELIDGRAMARDILNEVQQEVEKLDFQPVFCDVLVGDDPVSEQYVRMKQKKAYDVGLGIYNAQFPSDITTEKLVEEVTKINTMPNMCGLIIQLPLPEHIDTQAVLDAVDPSIDVDALGTETSNAFYAGQSSFVFPTAAAVIHILDSLNIDLLDKKIAMIGRGKLVGKPVAHLLESRGLDVTVVHSQTENPDEITRNSDLVISAVGRDKFITAEKIKEGSIIIDAGTSEEDGNVVGDVDLDSISDIAAYASPTPGGVGPLTVAMLFKNVLLAAKGKKS